MGVNVEPDLFTIHGCQFQLVPRISGQDPPLYHMVQQNVGQSLCIAGESG